MPRILFTRAAREDLIEIWTHIADDDPSAADRVLDRLDEVAAHLDRRRRAALFDEIEALKLQAFLTGTDEHLFEDLKGRAQGVHVDGSNLAILDTV